LAPDVASSGVAIPLALVIAFASWRPSLRKKAQWEGWSNSERPVLKIIFKNHFCNRHVAIPRGAAACSGAPRAAPIHLTSSSDKVGLINFSFL
jgi:hypothetical protein